MPPKTQSTATPVDTRIRQIDQRVLAEIMRYKAAHDGLSPSPLEISRAASLTTDQVRQSLDRLAVEWKINILAADFSQMVVVGARWLPPNEGDDRPFYEKRAAAELAAENARLRESLDNASHSWKTYQDRAGLLETLIAGKVKTIETLKQELQQAKQEIRAMKASAGQVRHSFSFSQPGLIAQPVLLA